MKGERNSVRKKEKEWPKKFLNSPIINTAECSSKSADIGEWFTYDVNQFLRNASGYCKTQIKGEK